ncbi:Sel1 domain-containing protein repeat-containing protein [Hydrogenophaga taeniospiralis CCUG 15921]|uniref:Sel1 domain-containing protein repeat-containing protein n=1 Tax=Hydrogenophaga taeniospiralis CCUG 15921 TaxID=1281780 RepID=A0A9X4NNJ8_9BURK|nr:SEL1-like repeat protein [Hydrogenophaga taeniospiralis]MDG5974620.1 Sel1 domain-containing protein repeat-containing protein [Hydrogenophaga taeniospiralis CCUG 15921]
MSPLTDPWVTAEIERLKNQAMRVAPAAQDASSAQQRRNAAQAAWYLGLIYFHGAGVQQNLPQAQQWFTKAHALGHPLASAGLAMCEIDGCVGPANPVAARPWIQQLRRTSMPRALFLEWLVEYRLAPITFNPGLAPGTSATVALPAYDLLTRAANAGDPHARIEIGLGLAVARQWTAALTQLELAAPRSAVAAANAAVVRDMLAREQTPDSGTPRQARTLLQEARRQHRGEGVTANYSEALRLYRQAEAAGSEEAGRMLALISSRPAADGGVNIEWMRQLAYVDLSQAIPTLGSPASGYRLQREPSPLFDLMPEGWRNRIR